MNNHKANSKPIKNEKIFIKCALNNRCISSICEQLLCEMEILSKGLALSSQQSE